MKNIELAYHMEDIIRLAKEGKVEKVNFLYGNHKKMWGILGEWEGNTKNLYQQKLCSDMKKDSIVKNMGYEVEEIDSSCFACAAQVALEVANDNIPIIGATCDTCPLQWTDEYGHPVCNCYGIYHAWRQEAGEEKKRLAKMIRDMPLKDDAELFYNIVE